MCSAIRIAHAEVDDVLTAATRRSLEFAGDIENIGGQPADAGEFVHGYLVVPSAGSVEPQDRC
jgi:hypothetical protein